MSPVLPITAKGPVSSMLKPILIGSAAAAHVADSIAAAKSPPRARRETSPLDAIAASLKALFRES